MTILHPTDFSDAADHAQHEAIRLGQAMGAEVVLLHVAVETPLYGEGPLNMGEVRKVYAAARSWAAAALEARAAAIRERGLASRWRLETGVPHEEIVKAAAGEHADFIVLGTHGRRGLDRLLLGSVAERVVRTARCPVVTVRTPEA
jgi:nucleotide-binding universal stress UspA family protein